MTSWCVSTSATSRAKPPQLDDKPAPERCVCVRKRSADDYNGFDVIGGCATGHFVHRVAPSGPASGAAGLQPGDHVLELNGVNFRRLTSEQAAAEVSRPCDKLTLRVQYCVTRYQAVLSQHHCDALYVRCLWDYAAEKDGDLSFKKVRHAKRAASRFILN